MKRFVIYLFACSVLVAALLACGEASSNSGTAVSTSQETPASAPVKHFAVGQGVKIGNTYEVTINSVKTSPGDDISQPKSGNQYLLVDASIKNISSKEQDVSSIIMWHLQDATGLTYHETFTDLGQAPDGKVEPGSPIRGTLSYEVPTTVKKFSLSFQADFTASGQTIWDLSV